MVESPLDVVVLPVAASVKRARSELVALVGDGQPDVGERSAEWPGCCRLCRRRAGEGGTWVSRDQFR